MRCDDRHTYVPDCRLVLDAQWVMHDSRPLLLCHSVAPNESIILLVEASRSHQTELRFDACLGGNVIDDEVWQ